MGLWRKAAELGSADAQFALAIAHLEDGRVGKDPVGARAYLMAAAGTGHVPAMTRLGRLFEEGTGGPAKPMEAVRWYRAAADAGDAEAMVRLAAAYEHGIVVPHDPVVALDWYGKAADMGQPAHSALWQSCSWAVRGRRETLVRPHMARSSVPSGRQGSNGRSQGTQSPACGN